MPDSCFRHLPALGFVAFKDESIIAASFLRCMEGPYALFDGLISNPYWNSKLRNEAIEAVVKQTLQYADSIGISKIIFETLDAGTIERSKSHGFQIMPRVLMMREGNKRES